jgi:hypothetical protein
MLLLLLLLLLCDVQEESFLHRGRQGLNLGLGPHLLLEVL